MAKNKKLNKIFQDKAILKAFNSVPVASYSNADDWRRVKRIGKEMQVKTFKSLNVSIEKNSSSVVFDDNVPCNNTTKDTKHISRESNISNYLCNNNISLKVKSLEDSLQEKENTHIITDASDKKYHTIDLLYSYNEENNSFSSIISTTRFPLEGLNNESNECFINQKKYIKNHTNCSDVPIANHSFIIFTKLGKMSKKRKNISFVWLGSLKPKQKIVVNSPNMQKPYGIIIKNNEPANFYYTTFSETKKNLKRSNIDSSHSSRKVSLCRQEEMKMLPPEKDSQLKFLTIESPIYESDKKFFDMNETKNKPVICNLNKSNISMQIDEKILSMNNILKHVNEKEIQENECSKNTKNVSNKNIKYQTEVIDANEQSYKIDIAMDIGNNIDKLENNETSEVIIESPVRKNSVQKHLIEESLLETENHNTQKSYKNEINCTEISLNRNSEKKTNSDSQCSLTFKVKTEKEFEENKSCSSNSIVLISDRKKKRIHSESLNNDVLSIIVKWCNPEKEPIIKKQKTLSNNENDLIFDQSESKVNDLDVLFSNNNNTLAENGLKQLEINKKQNDSSVDKIINKVENFEKNIMNAKKLMDKPTLSLSADLFKSNKHCVKFNSQSCPKHKDKIMNVHSSINNWCTDKSRKENFNLSPTLLNSTVIDLIQFEVNNSILSQNLQNSNKKDSVYNEAHINTVIKNKFDDIDQKMKEITFQNNDEPELIKNDYVNNNFNMYNVPESLRNITQEKKTLKKIEKAHTEVNLSEMNIHKNEEMNESIKFSTLIRKNKNSINNNTDDDFYSDRIDATPVSKKRLLQQFQTPISASNLEKKKTNSPQKNETLIAMVTLMKNTKCYLLTHSTPMVSTSPLKSKSYIKKRSIILVCTGLQPENIKLVQLFAKKFGIGFHNNFHKDVTHVIVQTDVETNSGQKTFKYIQGITFKKYVINFQWIVDCLNQNILINEDDEKYEVLDPDIFESVSKKCRNRTEELFHGFVFYCQGPFNSFPLNEFKNVILFNGGSVAPTLKLLSFYEDKYKIIILEHENFSQSKLASLKKSQAVLISFEWVVDSISRYQTLSLSSYLCGMTVEEAIVIGFPPEYFVEEETLEEKKEDDEDEEEL